MDKQTLTLVNSLLVGIINTHHNPIEPEYLISRMCIGLDMPIVKSTREFKEQLNKALEEAEQKAIVEKNINLNKLNDPYIWDEGTQRFVELGYF